MTTDNSWALADVAGDGSDQGEAIGVTIGAPLGPAPSGRASHGTVLHVITAVIFAAAGVSLGADMFTHILTSSPLYEYPDYFPYGILGVVLLAVAALLSARKTRAFAAGAAVAVALTWVARNFAEFRPSVVKFPLGETPSPSGLVSAWLDIELSEWLYLGAVVAMVIGAVPALVLGFAARRGADPNRGRTRPSTVRRIALMAGLGGAAAWFGGVCMNEFSNSVQGYGTDAECCSFSIYNNWGKADLIGCAVVLALLAVVGGLARSRGWGAGLLFGAFSVLFAGQVEIAFQFLAPGPSSTVPPYPQIWISGLGISGSPLAGFWITSAGMVLVLAAGVLLLADRTRRPPYLGAVEEPADPVETI